GRVDPVVADPVAQPPDPWGRVSELAWRGGGDSQADGVLHISITHGGGRVDEWNDRLCRDGHPACRPDGRRCRSSAAAAGLGTRRGHIPRGGGYGGAARRGDCGISMMDLLSYGRGTTIILLAGI